MSQLYSIDYLEQTTKALEQLKLRSYDLFTHITKGHVADIGCGTGADALNMARRLGEQVQVTGVDIAAEMIDKARSSAEGVANLDFRLSAADTLPFGDNELQGVRNERLIQHLPDAPASFREFYRVMAPEAPLVSVETAWSSISFYNGDYSTGSKLRDYLTGKNVRNGAAAANLTNYMQQAGFREISLEVFPFVLHSLQQVVAMLRIDHAMDRMLEEAIISGEEHKSFWSSVEDADRNHYFACSINIIVATGKK